MTKFDKKGLWDPMAHQMGDLVWGSMRGAMGDHLDGGPMESGPHLDLHPTTKVQERRLSQYK